MRIRTLGAGIAALALVAGLPASATAETRAAATPRITTLNQKVVLPYSLALRHGRVYVADGATATVSRVRGDDLVTVAEGPRPLGPGDDVAGLAFSRDGRRLAFTTSLADHSSTTLEVRGPYGQRSSVDLAGYEKTANPDQAVSYGIDNPDACAIEAFKDQGGASYTGSVDSHPYAVAAWGRRSWIVADAGGNDLLKVDRRGRVSTVAVLPRQPLLITAALAAAQGLPDCVVGKTYNFESVPTDVEVGRDGWLYVTTLAGGPEDPSAGARSKVYRVNPRTGRAHAVITGLAGATNLALGRHGEVFVTEFFAGKVTKIDFGRRTTLATLPGALSVEKDASGLYVGTAAPFGEQGPQGNGSIVRIG